MSAHKIRCLDWLNVSWTTKAGERTVRVLCEVEPVAARREVHSRGPNGEWSVTVEPCEELSVYVEQVRSKNGRKVDLGAFVPAERIDLYEAVRAAFRERRES